MVFLLFIMFMFLILSLSCIFHYAYCHWTPFAKKFSKIPSNIPYFPLLGTTLVSKFNKDIVSFDLKPLSPISRAWGIYRPFVFTTDCDIIEKVMSAPPTITRKADDYMFFERTFGKNNIMATNVKGWRQARRIVTSGIKPQVFQNLVQNLPHHINNLTDALDKAFAQHKGKYLNIEEFFGHLTLDLVCDTILDTSSKISTLKGVSMTAEGHVKPHEILHALKGMSKSLLQPVLNPFMQFNLIWHAFGRKKELKKNIAKIREMFPDKQIIQEKMKSLVDECNNESQRKLNFSENIYKNSEDTEAAFFTELAVMWAATDSSMVTINVTLYLLAAHPSIQAKAREEIASISNEDDEPLTLENLNELKYLDCVLKESMRLIAPVPFLGAAILKDMEFDGGLLIPSGTTVLIPVKEIHRDELWYDQPLRFIPERWLEGEKKPHPYAFLAFSGGQRSCPGQRIALTQMKYVIASMLLNYDITTEKKLEELQFVYKGLDQEAVGGLPMNLKRRN